MIWYNSDALQLLVDFTTHLPKNESQGTKCKEAATKFVTNHVPTGDVKSFQTKFKRLITSKPGNKDSAEIVDTWKKEIFFQYIPPDEKIADSVKKGRPYVTLSNEPCLKKSRSILKKMVDAVEAFATEQKIAREDALDLIVEECNRSWNTSIISTKVSIPELDATALVYNLDLSIHQYQMLRTLCLSHGVSFPVRNAIDKVKKTLHPDITSYQLKSSVNPTSLLQETAASLVKISKTEEIGGTFHLIGKFGVDGSGSHKIRQQLIETSLAANETPHLDPTKCNSFLLSCYVPLVLHQNDTAIWTNPVPNGTCYARPVSLTRAPEERGVLAIELEPSFEVIRDDYEATVLQEGEQVKVLCKTECSMMDGKMVSLLVGDSGAFCHLCHVIRATANDPTLIAAGFDITKDYASCKEAWDKLVAGDIAYSSHERQGQCHENIAKTDLHCFSVLHFKLRALDFAQKILYHLVAGVKVWSETANLHDMSFLDRAKKDCIAKVREKTSILMDSPCGSGGNTNTGPLADRFFNPINRSAICSLILNKEDREMYSTFMSLTNIMLAVTQAVNEKVVRIDDVKDLGIELMLHCKTAFVNEKGQSWVMLIPSFHQMCGHGWELFKWNNGLSIAKWSENPVESWNKHVRSFQSGPAARSRQHSIKDNIRDIFCRMLIKSHPEVASRRPRPSCSICGEVGHTARSARHSKASVSTEENARIDSLYY